MYKKIIIVLLLILFSYNCYAVSLNLTKTTYGKENKFQGNIIIPAGIYQAEEKITLSTSGDSKQYQIGNLIDCNQQNCVSTLQTYSTTAATSNSLYGQTILTGFKLRKNSLIQDASFQVSNYNSDLPDAPIIDIGNDNSLDWIYPGSATDVFDAIPPLPTSNLEETVITENCQKFTLPKSLKYKVKVYVKKLSSSATLDIFIPNIQQDQAGSCLQPETSWSEIECNIELASPLSAGDYYFCLIGSNNVLATNSLSQNPQGYVGCSSSCLAVNKDYIMNFSAASFITTLNHVENFIESNTKKDSFGVHYQFTDLLNTYLETCPIQNDYCILPINVSSKNQNQVQVSNLNYKETTELGEVLLKHEFLSSVTPAGTSIQLTLNSPIQIYLSDLNFETPSKAKDYELQLTFLNQTITANYTVVESPIANINVSKTSASILEPIQFSSSQLNASLNYLWQFGDGVNSTSLTPSHSYSKAGTYVVTLTITDTNEISSTAKKTIIIGKIGAATSMEEAIKLVDQAEQYYNTAQFKIKDIYLVLNLDTEIKNAKTTLVGLSDASQISDILDKLPRTLIIKDSYEIVPFLTTQDLNLLLPLQEESFKESARQTNEKVAQKIYAYLISITYLSDKKEEFILIKKTMNVPNTIPNPSIIDLIPSSVVSSQDKIIFINPLTADVTNYNTYQNIKFQLPSIDKSKTNEISYKVFSSNFKEIPKMKTIILPENLNLLLEIDCGNNICNPGEDIISCPEDCKCGNKKCDIDETEITCPKDCQKIPTILYISIFIIIGIVAISSFIIYKNPRLMDKFSGLSSYFQFKSPFSSEEELQKVINFIKASKKEGHIDKQITISLLKKGWTKAQVNYAMKKSLK